MNSKLCAAILISGSLAACSGDDGNENNANNINNVTPDCTTPQEIDVAAFRDGGTLDAGSCYLVNQRFLVDGGTLTIEEGVQLQFNADISLDIAGDGRLSVNGTEDAPVFFTGQEEMAGFWKGLKLETSGADNVVDYLVIEFAGSDQWTGADFTVASLYATDGAGVEITNCEIRNGSGHAFELLGGSEISLSTCAISNNDFGGYVHPDVAEFVAGDNTFTDNTNNVVRVSFGNNDTVESARTWADIGVPWRIENRTLVGAQLTLDPGVVLEFNQDASLELADEGRLNAVGTAESPITFTGVEKTPGYWKGIKVPTQGEANVLDFAIIEFAGSDSWTGGADTETMLRIESGASLAITNTIFRDSANYGIVAQNDVVFAAFEGNTFENNAKVAHFHPNIVGQVSADNTFTGNTENALRVTFGNNDAVEVAAQWAAIEVPYLVSNRTFINAALTIEAGTTIQFLENASFSVKDEGSLNAVGTAAAPILFTAVEGEETAGFWKGIEFDTASVENVLDFVMINYAGAETWYGGANASGALYVPGTLSISNATIADIAGWGIDASGNDSILACSTITFENVVEPVKDAMPVCM